MKLTSREIEVLIKIAHGNSNKHIAKDLLISVMTVRKHRQNLYKKLNVKNVAQLTRYAIDSEHIQNMANLIPRKANTNITRNAVFRSCIKRLMRQADSNSNVRRLFNSQKT